MIAAAAAGDQTKKEDQPLPDADPDGKLLAKTETPLEEALKLFAPLETLAAGRVETWTIAYEIDIRRSELVVFSLNAPADVFQKNMSELSNVSWRRPP